MTFDEALATLFGESVRGSVTGHHQPLEIGLAV